jgi:hypothetical protein
MPPPLNTGILSAATPRPKPKTLWDKDEHRSTQIKIQDKTLKKFKESAIPHYR